MFDNKCSYILKPGFKIPDEWILLSSPRKQDLYIMDMKEAKTTSQSATCFVSKASEKETIAWHRRMGHIHIRKMNQLVHNELVIGVNLKIFKLNDVCVSCKKGKQTKKAHKSKKYHAVNIPLELLHMDLFGPVNRKSIAGNWYCLVVTDDFSRFSWVMFMAEKSDTFSLIKLLITQVESLYKLKVRRIRSDNGTEFKNNAMIEFCQERGILREYSSPYTPQ
jgi:transposase InsO family protein